MKKRLRIDFSAACAHCGNPGLRLFSRQGNGSTITASGNIEVNEAQMSFKIAGRLKKRLVDEGDKVIAGQLLATLEDTDQKIAVSQAEASLAQAQARLAELEAGSRSQEIEGARAELRRSQAALKTAEAQLTQARDDFNRYAAIFKEGGLSRKDYDQYNTRYIAAGNTRTEAKAQIKVAAEQLSLLVAGPRKETIDQARAQTQVATEAVNQARQQEKYTELYAPMDGIILSKSAEPGEYLNPASPVVTIGDTAHPWLRTYIREQDRRITLNQKARVTTDAFPDKNYQGVIIFVSDQAEFTPKAVQTFEERVKLMYRIKIQLDNPLGELKPGMPADAVIDLSKKD